MSGENNYLSAIRDWPARYFLGLAFVPGVTLAVLASPSGPALKMDALDARWRVGLLLATLGFVAVALVKGYTLWDERRRAESAAQEAKAAELRVQAQKRREEEQAARSRQEAFEREMRELTVNECRVLAKYVDQGSKTADFQYTGELEVLARTAHSLFMRGHLTFLAKGHNGFWEFWSYMIQPSVYRYLQGHPELLDKGRVKSKVVEVSTPPKRRRRAS